MSYAKKEQGQGLGIDKKTKEAPGINSLREGISNRELKYKLERAMSDIREVLRSHLERAI